MESNYLQIVRSVYNGISQRQTAKLHGVSRSTVAILVRYAQSQGWLNSQDLNELTNLDFEPAMQRKTGLGENRDESYELPDYEYVHAELAKQHVTLTLLWEEYVEECIQNGNRYYMETQFRRYYHKYAKTEKATIRLHHKPGIAVQLDWAGSKIAYYDEDEGELCEASLFVAVLPCSQLIYAEVFRNEKLPSWIAAHINCFKYFGGVPKTLVPDNLKTGVNKAIFYEPELNRTYQEMAEYYGTVILPTRARKPKDKAAVENSVKIASHRILGKLRNKTFHNFFDLHESVEKALEEINSAPLTGRSVSRWNAFNGEEKDFLLTLPPEPFLLSEWSEAKVQPNCHVSYRGCFYSVPFEYLGESMDIRATDRTVEIFYHHQRVASHKRSWGNNRYITVNDHMPPGKLFFVDWDQERFLSWAEKIGRSCKKVIQGVLDKAVIEQQAYRSCFGILGLKDKYSSKRLEAACAYLLEVGSSPTYSQIKRILEREEDLVARENESNQITKPKGFSRGADYFGKK